MYSGEKTVQAGFLSRCEHAAHGSANSTRACPTGIFYLHWSSAVNSPTRPNLAAARFASRELKDAALVGVIRRFFFVPSENPVCFVWAKDAANGRFKFVQFLFPTGLSHPNISPRIAQTVLLLLLFGSVS